MHQCIYFYVVCIPLTEADKNKQKNCSIGIEIGKSCWTSANMFWTSVGESRFKTSTKDVKICFSTSNTSCGHVV